MNACSFTDKWRPLLISHFFSKTLSITNLHMFFLSWSRCFPPPPTRDTSGSLTVEWLRISYRVQPKRNSWQRTPLSGAERVVSTPRLKSCIFFLLFFEKRYFADSTRIFYYTDAVDACCGSHYIWFRVSLRLLCWMLFEGGLVRGKRFTGPDTKRPEEPGKRKIKRTEISLPVVLTLVFATTGIYNPTPI